MIYFKYKTSFKEVKNLANFLQKQEIEYIDNEEDFKKHFKKYDNLYCFINPYKEEIDSIRVLDWGLSESDAMNKFYLSQAEI